MLLFSCYTPAHEVLYRNIFAPSLPAGFRSEASLINQAGAGDFLSPEFLRCIRKKIALIRTSLVEHDGDVIAWSDVDIRFVNLTPRKLLDDFAAGHADILFQQESPRMPDVNTGFFVCRCNHAVRNFIDRVGQRLEEDEAINEQAAVNQLLTHLPENQLPKWARLPATYYARTHGWPPPRDLSLYHANYTKGSDGVEQKLAQFRELETLLNGGWRERMWSIMRRIPTKLASLVSNR